MSVNALIPAPKPKSRSRLRGILYASALLAGGGVIGAIIVGPTLGQGGGPDGPRWQRGGDQQSESGGWRGRRGWDNEQQSDDDGPRGRRMGRWGGPGRDGGDRMGRDGGERMGGRDGGERMHGGLAGTMHPGAIERRVNRVLGAVDASTEQRQKVRGIFEAAANDMFPMRQQGMDNRKQMHEALGAATIDRAKIEALRTDQMKLADARSKRMTTALADAAEVLTPAQRADLASRFQRRRGG
jgi:periplasmic protein CpxP/Spy